MKIIIFPWYPWRIHSRMPCGYQNPQKLLFLIWIAHHLHIMDTHLPSSLNHKIIYSLLTIHMLPRKCYINECHTTLFRKWRQVGEMSVNIHYSGKVFPKFILKHGIISRLLTLHNAIQIYMWITVTLYCLENNDKEKCLHMLTKDVNMLPQYFCSLKWMGKKNTRCLFSH